MTPWILAKFVWMVMSLPKIKSPAKLIKVWYNLQIPIVKYLLKQKILFVMFAVLVMYLKTIKVKIVSSAMSKSIEVAWFVISITKLSVWFVNQDFTWMLKEDAMLKFLLKSSKQFKALILFEYVCTFSYLLYLFNK